MLKNSKKSQSGFTIIEVLIVLAIAGLIMLVVFLAIPALQRNSHNTQRKSDVSSLIGALQEYEDNNNGQLPAAASDFTANWKPGFYQTSDVVYSKNGSAQTDASSWSTTSSIYVETYAKCGATQGTLDNNPTSRNVVAWYFVEVASGSPQKQCQDV